MLRLIANENCKRTGELLLSKTNATDHPNTTGTICWGKGTTATPALNGRAGNLNKIEQGLRLLGNNIPSISYFSPDSAARLMQDKYPLLGRKFSHRAGRDIVVAFNPLDVHLRGSHVDFYTAYEHFRDEYRIWIYRSLHLGSYKKVLDRPELYRKPGRNYRNGWKFQLVPSRELPRDAIQVAADSLRSLDLDFGGIDLGILEDGTPKVIEVNTAPSVESEDRQVLNSLARHVTRWHNSGFPKRRGSRE